MSDSWDEMRRAKEEQYFLKENEAALKRLKESNREKPRLSPISGKPMKQVTMMGVNIDQCEESGGIWLDKGELEILINAAQKDSQQGLFQKLLGGFGSK
jgi:Transcription factor zinc-finger